MRKPVLNSPTDRFTHEQIRAILTPTSSGRRDEYVCPVCDHGHLFLYGDDDFDCKNDCSNRDVAAVVRKQLGLGERHIPKVMPKPSANGKHPAEEPGYEGYTPAQYAADKKLHVAWLIMNYAADLSVPTPMQGMAFGKPYLKLAYMTADREVVFTRRRYSAETKPRSEYGSKMTIPYGLWLWTNKPDKKGVWPRAVVICEGESDQQTLTLYGIPAIGAPGVDNWKSEWADLPIFKYADRVFVIQEDDKPNAGRKFVQNISRSFPAGKVVPVKLFERDPEVKDPSRLHIDSEIAKELGGDSTFGDEFVASVKEALNTTRKDADWPEPMREEAFYGLPGQLVQRLAPEVESDSVALLANFLSMAGVLFGREAWAQVGATRHYPFEFVTLVGATSRARKGTGTNLVLSVVERVEEGFEKERVLSGLSTGEGLIKAVQDKDEAIRNRGFLVKLGEFASLLEVMKRESNTMSAALRQAWDGERLRVLTRKEPLDADNVNLSVVAHITQSELLNKLTTTDRVNGFANRFLMLCTRRDKLLPRGGGVPNTSDLVVAIHDAVEAAKGRGAIARSNEAEELWSQEYAKLTSGGDGLKDALCARAEAHVLRLSLLYALLDSSSEIRPEHLRAAIAFWDYCERSVGHIFGGTTGDADGDKLLTALSNGPMTRSDITRLYGGHRTAEWLDAKLAHMVRTGRVQHTKLSKSGKEYEAFEKA